MVIRGFTPALCGLLACVAVQGASSADPVDVVQASKGETFLQLASSGRKNIAASDDRVGIVWEAVQNGSSTVYVAFKNKIADAFDPPQQLSDGDAFSPVISQCEQHFYIAWIEEGGIRAINADDIGTQKPITASSEGDVNEISIGCQGDQALLAYSSRQDKGFAVYATGFSGEAYSDSQAMASIETFRFQTNPGITTSKGRIVVTWHDRSTGTNLLYATSGESLEALDKQVQINELIQKSHEWGSGSSAVRSSLANGKNDRLAVIWLDKRSSRTGYKVYSSFSHDGGITWGDNYLVSDEWGDIVPAWTPAIASDGKKKTAVVWMDKREEENALWLSELHGLSWSQNRNLYTKANEPHSPVIAYSPDGQLHAAWIESGNEQSSTIRYWQR